MGLLQKDHSFTRRITHSNSVLMLVKTVFLCSFTCFASNLLKQQISDSKSEDYDAINLANGLLQDTVVENETETKTHDENQITDFQEKEKDINDLNKLISNASEKEKKPIGLSDVFHLQPVMAGLFDFLIGKEIYALKSTNSQYSKLLDMWIESYDNAIQARRKLENAHISSLYEKENSWIHIGFSS